jgi:hypothetical protein
MPSLPNARRRRNPCPMINRCRGSHETRDYLAASRDDNFLTGFDPVEQLPEFVFRLEGSDFFHALRQQQSSLQARLT